MVQDGLYDDGIAILRDGLEAVCEIIVVVVETYRQSFKNAGGQLNRAASPLFLGITFEEGFI